MKRTLAIAAAILTVLIGVEAPAQAADFVREVEDEYAASAYDPNGEYCVEYYNPILQAVDKKGCFTRYGDVFHIQDAFPDTNSTYIYWENWLKNGTGWSGYRHGYCTNDLGSPNWGKCNKDLYENSSTNYFGSKGSRVRFIVCKWGALNSCTSDIEDAAWIYNNA